MNYKAVYYYQLEPYDQSIVLEICLRMSSLHTLFLLMTEELTLKDFFKQINELCLKKNQK